MPYAGRSRLFAFYPLLVMAGLATFTGLQSGFEIFRAGNPMNLINGSAGVIVVVAVLVLLISPLLVLWWLTRPSEPGTNECGPNPYEVTT